MPCVAANLELQIERARQLAGTPFDRTLAQPPTNDPHAGATAHNAERPRPRYDATTFAAAYERYINDPTHRWSASTRQTYTTSKKLAVSIIGADIPIASIARAHCRDYLDVLRHLPRNATKRFPKLTAREASKRGHDDDSIEVMSTANANVNLANLSSFLNWAVNEELLPRNPMRGLRLPDEVAKRDKRFPFSAQQLRAIFDAPLYRGCIDGDRGYAKVGAERPRNARFWVPLIALHSGMRLNEICQLDVADIRVVEGISCFVVSEHSLAGSDDKTLKTGASKRLVPVHGTLIDCGLNQYLEQQRRAERLKLFDDIDPGSQGKRAVSFSKWFTRFLRNCNAHAERTCFHSFRHNFRDELRAARVDHDVSMALGGWVSVGSRDNQASENYGHGHRVAALSEAINQLTFENIDLSHLKWCA